MQATGFTAQPPALINAIAGLQISSQSPSPNTAKNGSVKKLSELALGAFVSILENDEAVFYRKDRVTLLENGLSEKVRERLVNLVAKFIVQEYLSQFDRRNLYALLKHWKESFEFSSPLRDLIADALELIRRDARDKELQKGALNVLLARIQTKLVDAITLDDHAKIGYLVKALTDNKIPLHKIAKNYRDTTERSLPSEVLARVKRSVLRHWITLASQCNDHEKTKDLLKQFFMTEECSFAHLQRLFSVRPIHTSTKAFFRLANDLCNMFSMERGNIEDVVSQAKKEGITISELVHFAVELHLFRKGTLNSRTEEALQIARMSSLERSSLLAQKLYLALTLNSQVTISQILEEVKRLGIIKQFACHLYLHNQQADRVEPAPVAIQIAKRTIDIFFALSALAPAAHHMSPLELLESARAVEGDFRETIPTGNSAKVVRQDGRRTRLVDPHERSVTFLNRSKGGTLYTFGSSKKVTSSFTIQLSLQNNTPQYSVRANSMIILRKSALTSNALKAWKRETRVLKENRGLSGLLVSETGATYTRTVVGVTHERELIITPIYSQGNLEDIRVQHLALASLIKIFLGVAKGLRDLHLFQQMQPDNSLKVMPRVHGDINLKNMLISDDGSAVLCDFNFSCSPEHGESMPFFAPYYGTPGHSDPDVTVQALSSTTHQLALEVMRGFDGRQLDCFAMGVCMYVALYGFYPPALKMQMKLYIKGEMNLAHATAIAEQFKEQYRVDSTELESRKDHVSSKEQFCKEQFERIAWKMMNPNRADRMTAVELVPALEELFAQTEESNCPTERWE